MAPTTEPITFRGIITWDFSPTRRQYSRSAVASGGKSSGSLESRSTSPW